MTRNKILLAAGIVGLLVLWRHTKSKAAAADPVPDLGDGGSDPESIFWGVGYGF